jgi:hypothetical protein
MIKKLKKSTDFMKIEIGVNNSLSRQSYQIYTAKIKTVKQMVH